jgi:hypothetical protein
MAQTSDLKSGNIKWVWKTPVVISILALFFYWLKFSNVTLNEDCLNKIPSWVKSHFENLSTKPGDWGTFGDYLGGLLNPVIAGCTLFVAISVWRAQEKLLNVQLKIADQDRTEQRFFDLINIYQKVVDGITPHPVNPHKLLQLENEELTPELEYRARLVIYEQRQIQLAGKAAIQDWRLKLDDNHCFFKILGREVSKEERANQLNHSWGKSEVEFFLLSYYKIIMQIIIHSEEILKKDHFKHVQFFKSQLSHAELILIAYYLIATKNQEFIQKSTQYGLLENISDERKLVFEKYLDAAIFSNK